MNSDSVDDINSLRRDVQASLDMHKRAGSLDAWLYNGGTALILLCTALATYLPATGADLASWLPQVLTGIATFWVALDRALTFGLRWRFHITQGFGYQRIIDRFAYCSHLNAEDRKTCIREALAQLDAVRTQEGVLPGIGAPKPS